MANSITHHPYGRTARSCTHQLDSQQVRALATAAATARDLLTKGVRQEHGLHEPQPLSAAARRDLATIERTVRRILDREAYRG